ncbi:hypothetical protein RFI_13113, partial [Reticulomyxa filosa]
MTNKNSEQIRTILKKKKKRYLDLPMRFILSIQHHGIDVIVVFDGAQLPMKKEEEIRRAKKREMKRLEGEKLWNAGDRKKSYECFQQSVRITHTMIETFQQRLKTDNIPFVVAPYEADAQLAYLFKQKRIDFVISEDSDLLVFGVQKLLTKFNRNNENGTGQFIDMTLVANYKSCGDKNDSSDCFVRQIKSFTHQKFVQCCVLSGCDYLESIKGVGLRTAAKLMRSMESVTTIMWKLKGKNEKEFPKTYPLEFEKAVMTFLYQYVYDLDTRSM